MHQSQTYFKSKSLPILLLTPQLIITLIFFVLPSLSAFKSAFFQGDAFGIHSQFAGLNNFLELFKNSHYLNAVKATLKFSLAVSISSLLIGLFLAVLIDRVIWGKSFYKTLIIWPYAVAPAISGILWRFLFDPAVGILAYVLGKFGIQWDYHLNVGQATFLVVLASSWQQFSYNFIFFLAGLQAIPKTLIEAAAIDGAGPFRRFWHITLPLLSPTSFFLLVINLIYAFFDTFGVIDTMTQGGPQETTNILVYKVYHDGFIGLDLGSSSAQSVILMIIVLFLTVLQFRYIEKKVYY